MTSPNPLLREIGLGEDDRVVILHADDIGMCQATVSGFTDLLSSGLQLSASLMAPAPWFPCAAAVCCQSNRSHIDAGVHLTLTSEWETYRWGPVFSGEGSSGLRDKDGYFPRSVEQLWITADPQQVKLEISAQLEKAFSLGIDVTHIDCHMGAVFHPRFFRSYIEAALELRVMPVWLRQDANGFRQLGVKEGLAEYFADQSALLESEGLPLLDHLHQMPLREPQHRLEQMKQALSSLPSGLTYFIIHPAHDTPELRAITPDWACRVADYEAALDDNLRIYMEQSGIYVVSYQALRDIRFKQT